MLLYILGCMKHNISLIAYCIYFKTISAKIDFPFLVLMYSKLKLVISSMITSFHPIKQLHILQERQFDQGPTYGGWQVRMLIHGVYLLFTHHTVLFISTKHVFTTLPSKDTALFSCCYIFVVLENNLGLYKDVWLLLERS